MQYILVLFLNVGEFTYPVPNGLTCDTLYERLEANNIIQYVDTYDDEGYIRSKITIHDKDVLYAWGCQVNTI